MLAVTPSRLHSLHGGVAPHRSAAFTAARVTSRISRPLRPAPGGAFGSCPTGHEPYSTLRSAAAVAARRLTPRRPLRAGRAAVSASCVGNCARLRSIRLVVDRRPLLGHPTNGSLPSWHGARGGCKI